MRRWEIGRYTISQLVNALDRSDPTDPHRGQMEIQSLDDLEALFDFGGSES